MHDQATAFQPSRGLVGLNFSRDGGHYLDHADFLANAPQLYVQSRSPASDGQETFLTLDLPQSP